ncbi:nucleotidyltransferase domain-containing protein [Scytonema tolypothrichoides VB-61278]|nr:nucleotidyltransferase domain-containing protein [Scytonema tolypothrichoides VB-61278]
MPLQQALALVWCLCYSHITMDATIQEYINKLHDNHNVLGVILFGSWARGNNRPDSDVDLLIVVHNGFKRTVEYYKERTFEITYTTEEDVIEYWKSNRDDAVELWSIATILFDRDGTIARLQQLGDELREQGKPPLSTDQSEHYKFDIYDQLKSIETLIHIDPVTAKMLLSIKAVQLTELFFDIRQLWTPPPKQRLMKIKSTDQNLHRLIVNYYSVNALAKQLEIIRSIANIVFDTVRE